MKYKLKEIKDGIFLVEFENQYDLCMTFLRYQEFYESANPRFRRKGFSILEYMEWYSNDRPGSKGAFTYPIDWAGFNVPVELIAGTGPIPDFNKYDQTMKNIVLKIQKKRGTLSKAYLLGSTKGNAEVLQHEMAHGLYHVYNFYKVEMDNLYSKLSVESRTKLNDKFKAMGYHKSVWKDEAQAYLSTGDYLTSKERKPFQEVFVKFTKGILF